MSFGFFNSNKDKGKPLPYMGFQTKAQIEEARKKTEKTEQDIEFIQKHLLADEKQLKELEDIYVNGFHEIKHLIDSIEQVKHFFDKIKQMEIEVIGLYANLINAYKNQHFSDALKIREQISFLSNNADQIISRIEPILDQLILKPSHKMYRDDNLRDHLHDIDKNAKKISDELHSIKKKMSDLNDESEKARKEHRRKIGFR